jgi:formate hydrogenlyase transcriptional activator
MADRRCETAAAGVPKGSKTCAPSGQKTCRQLGKRPLAGAEGIEQRLRFETLLADLSARFVGLPADGVDREIEGAQKQICQALGLDRSTLGQFLGPKGEPTFTHSWAAAGFEPNPLTPVGDLFPWLSETVRSGRTVCFASADELPEQAATDKETLRRLGPKSNLTLPLVVGGRVLGGLSFGSMREEREWPAALVSRLRLVAEIFANALARKRTEEALTLALSEVERLRDKLHDENLSLREELRSLHGPPRILGRSAAVREVLKSVEQVATAPSAVLITGETGTGKELVARAIHEASQRRDRAMIALNCGSLPEGLVESELFGREKGAYTGALTRQAGRFELAHRSTLFLDEVGDLPAGLQAKLLRVLQDGKFERLGGTRTIEVDVRILAATNKDLEAEVEAGRFRKDLFYRLNVFRIHIPPLRERPEDIPILVNAVVAELAARMGKEVDPLSAKAVEELVRYPWPGNVRELRNILEHAMILCQGRRLEVRSPSQRPIAATRPRTAEAAQRAHVLSVLEGTGWRVKGAGGAAETLGLKPTTLYSMMKRLGLPNRRQRYEPSAKAR